MGEVVIYTGETTTRAPNGINRIQSFANNQETSVICFAFFSRRSSTIYVLSVNVSSQLTCSQAGWDDLWPKLVYQNARVARAHDLKYGVCD